MFGSTRGTPVKRLKAIATQGKKIIPVSLWFEPGGSVEFWQILLNRPFKDDALKKNFK